MRSLIRIVPLFLALVALSSAAQAQVRAPLWYVPSSASKIYGLAIGPVNSSRQNDTTTQEVIGIHVEIGLGILMPLAPAHPFRGSKVYPSRREQVDAVLFDRPHPYPRQSTVNVHGFSIAATGSLGLHTVNGLHISPFASYAMRVNGVSINPMWNCIASVNGVAISILNNSMIYAAGLQLAIVSNDTFESVGLQVAGINAADLHRGLQIGAYNSSSRFQGLQLGLVNIADELDGMQIGLLNITKERWLPILNVD